jgi:hypothetical protein
VLTFGVIAGLILAASMAFTVLVVKDVGNKGEVIGYTMMVLAFSLVYFGVRSYRDNDQRGSIGFGRAFGVGVMIMALASCFYVAAWEVLYYNYMPDFGTKYAAAAVDRYKASGATAEQVAAKKAQMDRIAEMYKNPVTNAAITFLEPLPVGLVVALVCAGVLRRTQPEL